jgi:transketolase
VTLAAYGSAVHRICEAAEELKKAGISAEVIDCATIKPIDRDTLVASVKKTGRLITLEDHNLYGGLAAAVAEAVLGSGVAPKFKPLAVNDVFGISGNANNCGKTLPLPQKISWRPPKSLEIRRGKSMHDYKFIT